MGVKYVLSAESVAGYEKVTATTWKGTKTFTNVDRGYLLGAWLLCGRRDGTLTAEDSNEEMWADVYRFSENASAL